MDAILAWMVLRPLQGGGEDRGWTCLIIVFEPEKAGSKADWRPVGQAAIEQDRVGGTAQNHAR
jgi:hypothetical protein